MAKTNNGSSLTLGLLALIAVIAVVIFIFSTAPDNRTTGEKIGDAVDELPNVGEAAEELEDKNPAEKLGDSIEDFGERIEDGADR